MSHFEWIDVFGVQKQLYKLSKLGGGGGVIWATCTTFFKAKNADLSDIQNDSLSKILLK